MRNSSTVTIVVGGLGKIGLPLAVYYASQGCRVVGCDINPRVVEKINAGEPSIHGEPAISEELATLVSKGLLTATLNTIEAVRQCGVVIVIVPVEINDNHEADFEAIDAATIAIGLGLQPDTLVIYETTMPVGTTRRRFRQILEQTSRLKVGEDFYLAYSPERLRSGQIFRDLHTYPKIVGGINGKSLAAATAFYESVLATLIIAMVTTDEAEFVKLIENTYRDVNIALANEFACYADNHGLDVVASIAAANTQPTSHIHKPGVGVGGHCIPVDPYFLFTKVHDSEKPSSDDNLNMLLPRVARNVNDKMAEYAIKRLEDLVGSLMGRSILILGVTYRGNVRETAFTSARLLQKSLLDRGATVYLDDPLLSDDELLALGYIPLTPENEYEIFAIILQADHHAYQSFNFRRFTKCQAILDGRRALNRESVEALGIHYLAIGDGNQEKLWRRNE